MLLENSVSGGLPVFLNDLFFLDSATIVVYNDHSVDAEAVTSGFRSDVRNT